MRIIKGLLTCAFFIVGFGFGYGQEDLSLQDAIKIGLENNFDIRIARNEQEIARNDASLGNAGFLPFVSLSGSRTFNINSIEATFNNGNELNERGVRPDNLAAGLFVDWVLFDGMKMFATYDKLRELKRIGDDNARALIENAIVEIIKAYYAVVVEQERLKVLGNAVDISKERLDIAKSKYEVGKASKLEFLTAQVDYNADLSAKISQEEILYNTKVDLNRLLVRDFDTDYNLSAKIDIQEGLELAEIETKAMAANPNLLVARKNVNVAIYSMKEFKADRYPRLDFVVGYDYNRNFNPVGFLLRSQTLGFNYGLTAVIPLFDGFNANRRIQNAKIQLDNSQIMLDKLNFEIKAELRKAYVNYINNLRLLDLEQANLEAAKENAEIALDRYKLGNTTPLELREAQRNAVEAETRLLNAAFSTKQSEIELIRLSGGVFQEFEI